MADVSDDKARGAISGLPKALQGPAYLLISSALIGGLIFCDPTAFRAGSADGARIEFFERTLNILVQFWTLWALILEPRAVVNFLVVRFFRVVVFVLRPMAATMPGGFDWVGALAIADARLIRLSEPREHGWARDALDWITGRLRATRASVATVPGRARSLTQRAVLRVRAAASGGFASAASMARDVWRWARGLARSFAAKIVASALFWWLFWTLYLQSVGFKK